MGVSKKLSAIDLKNVFRDLRKRNEYGARVGRALEAKRVRRIEHVINAQRKHRAHQDR